MSNWKPQDYVLEFMVPFNHPHIDKEMEYRKKELFNKVFSGIENGDMVVVEYVEQIRDRYDYPEKSIQMRLNLRDVEKREAVVVRRDLSEICFNGHEKKSKIDRIKTSLKYIFDRRSDNQDYIQYKKAEK